ncbi:MAG: hypothetical protein M3Z33_01440 [Actinomycetota bacterium]|nr:hypothetical protein [Actinomycetota bacterium]
MDTIGRLERVDLALGARSWVSEFLGRRAYEPTEGVVSHLRLRAREGADGWGAVELARPRVRDAFKLGF